MRLMTFLLLLFLPLTMASAHSYQFGDMKIGHAWMRAVPAGSSVGAAYMPLYYSGGTKEKDFDVLLSASTPIADTVEFHNTVMNGDVMEMKHIPKIIVVSGMPIPMQPKGVHMMLFGIKKPVLKGEVVPMTLEFQKTGKVNIELHVADIGAMAGEH